MALQKQVVSFPLFGRSDGVAKPHISPGKMATLENAVIERTGELRKRFGQTSLSAGTSTGGTITAGRRLDAFGSELLMSDADTFYSFSDSDDKWYSRGDSQRFSVDVGFISEGGKGVTANEASLGITAGYGGGQACYVWTSRDAGGTYNCYRMVVDWTTGATIYFGSFATGYSRFHVVYAEGKFVIHSDSGATIRAWTFAPAAPATLTGPTTVVTGASSFAGGFDVKVMGDDGTIFCAAFDSGAGTIYWARYGSDLVVDASGTDTAPTAANGCICILEHDESDGLVWVGLANHTDGVSLRSVTKSTMVTASTTTIDAAATNVHAIVGYHIAGTASYLLYERGTVPTSTDAHYIERGTRTSGGAVSTAAVKRGCNIISKAWSHNSTYHIMVAHDSTLQSTDFILDATDGTIQGRMLAGYGDATRRNYSDGVPSDVARISSTQFLIAVRRKLRIRWESHGTKKWAVADFAGTSITINASDSLLAPGTEANNILALPGACPLAYDATSISAINTALFPEGTTAATAAGGSMDASAAYQYAFLYSWGDRRGNIHRSAASVPLPVSTTAANFTVNLTIPTLRMTDRSDIAIEVYRTEGNGTVFYYRGKATNSTTADTVAYADTAADSTITSNEILYTQGGILDNFPPPPCKQLVSWDNRLWAIGTEYSNEVWYSKNLSSFNGASFNPVLRVVVDNAEGGIKAGVAMDNQLVLFGRAAVYVVTGSGPNDLGQGEYSGPHIVSTKVGTTNPRSVVLTPMGVMFASAKGIYLLDRSLNASFIGADIEEFDTSTITGSLVVPDKNQVRFYTSGGTTLVYFWDEQQWATFTNQAAVGAANWQRETPCFLSSVGIVRYENTATYGDDGASISFTFKTGPISLAGIQGLKRVYEIQLLGEKRGDTTSMTLKTYVDNATTADETTSISIVSVAPDALRIGVQPKTQAMSSVELEGTFTSATEGIRLSGIGLVVGTRPGGGKLPAASRST